MYKIKVWEKSIAIKIVKFIWVKLVFREPENKLHEPWSWNLATFEFLVWIQILSPFVSNSWRFDPAWGCVEYAEYIIVPFFLSLNERKCLYCKETSKDAENSIVWKSKYPCERMKTSFHIEKNTVVFYHCLLHTGICEESSKCNSCWSFVFVK